MHRSLVNLPQLALTAFLAMLAAPTSAHAQLRAEVVATGFSSPLHFVQDPKSPDVVYIVEQGGLVQTLRHGSRLEPFIDLRGSISSGGERGLLGMAFDPDVASDRVFFNFTDTNGNTVIARFKRAPGNPLRADPTSRFDLRWPTGERFIRQPFPNHNGGNLVFGPDGYLYVGLGDGGSGNDPDNHAQNPFSLLGKMLRIDVAVHDGDASGYRVPADNPFIDAVPIPALAEIWDVGLRNPWRYSFDDLGSGSTGALIIADVGQTAREEIDYEPFRSGGRNYGWRIREGGIATPGIPPTTPAFLPLNDPVFEYGRSVGQAITGGYVYRGTALGPAYHGRYFFADFVSSRVWSIVISVNPATGQAVATDLVEHTSELGGNLGGVASFGRDASGELYLLSFRGEVLKIAPASVTAPPSPNNLSQLVSGRTVTLSWLGASGAPVTAYQIEAGSRTGSADLAIAHVAGTQTTATFHDVPVGVYHVRVRALNGTAASGPSNEIVVNVAALRSCREPPPAPTDLSAIVDGRTVALSWRFDTPVDAPVIFQIDAGRVSGSSDLASFIVGDTVRSIGGSVSPGTYFVRMRSVNVCGASAPSNEIVVMVF